MHSRILLPLIGAALTVALPAFAENKAVLSTARELAKQGVSAYEAGRYEEAVEKLSKAYQVVHVPTLALSQARALAKLGRLVAASELYLEATKIPRDPSWQSVQEAAQRDAARERSDLLVRIPRLKVSIEGVKPAEVSLTIDGTAVPPALNDAEQMVDPGQRTIVGRHGDQVITETASPKESEMAAVTLKFTDAPAAAGTSPAPNQTASVAPPTAASDRPAASSRQGNAQKVAGWVTLGVGGAGLVGGVVTGLLASSKRSSLLDSNRCSPDGLRCTPDQSAEVDSYNGLRSVSTIGFVAGGVLAATGITLILTSPRESSAPAVGLWLNPRTAGIYAGF
jgi:hypothetical protein